MELLLPSILCLTIISCFGQISAEHYQRTECLYANQTYPDGSKVHTESPCLRCACSTGLLRCRLRVCPEFPDPPPPGCITLTRRSECCPRLLCKHVGWRRGQENDRLQNRAVLNDLDFLRTKNATLSEGGCIIDGTIYSAGSATSNSNSCRACYCSPDGTERCASVECVPTPSGCIPVVSGTSSKPGSRKRSADGGKSCCPGRYVCPEKTDIVSVRTHRTLGGGCVIGGIQYKEGSMITDNLGSLSQNDPCSKCMCLHGVVKCTSVPCPVVAPLGCSPVFSTTNTQCCPERFECSAQRGSPEEVSGTTVSQKTKISKIIQDVLKNSETTTLFDFDKYETSDHKTNESLNSEPVTPKEDVSKKLAQKLRQIFKKSIENYETIALNNEGKYFYDNGNNKSGHDKRDVSGINITTDFVVDLPGNETRDENNDYELDYDTMLPPSLPNVRIIKFEAADALGKNAEADAPYKINLVSQSPFGNSEDSTLDYSGGKGFAPPVKTEGGFLPGESMPLFNNYVINPDRFVFTTAANEINTNAQKINSLLNFDDDTSYSTTQAYVDDEEEIILLEPKNTTSAPDLESGESELDKVLNYIFSPLEESLETTKTPKEEIRINVLKDHDKPSNSYELLKRNPLPAQRKNITKFHNLVLDNHTTQRSKLATKINTSKDVVKNIINNAPVIDINTTKKPLTTNPPKRPMDLQDSSSDNANVIFKLAGCNIYGKMYSVGQVIVELSNPCTECICDNIGVQCKDLFC
ncbi:uncharacterized protein LOC113366863 [Ctenocephalides felis]|uniref:uncharacterized protein LOC113366863 n=1 Tax=Ctenocephalides felis TaxID=7515 RepID=UPI000E6E13C0|nr:uncharacterized protein LOC113366863 [Ctenocephalides felis]